MVALAGWPQRSLGQPTRAKHIDRAGFYPSTGTGACPVGRNDEREAADRCTIEVMSAYRNFVPNSGQSFTSNLSDNQLVRSYVRIWCDCVPHYGRNWAISALRWQKQPHLLGP